MIKINTGFDFSNWRKERKVNRYLISGGKKIKKPYVYEFYQLIKIILLEIKNIGQ
jgi:hypothetical protein